MKQDAYGDAPYNRARSTMMGPDVHTLHMKIDSPEKFVLLGVKSHTTLFWKSSWVFDPPFFGIVQGGAY